MTAAKSLAEFWAVVANAVLGPRCRVGCGARVFPADIAWHEDREHAGDVVA